MKCQNGDKFEFHIFHIKCCLSVFQSSRLVAFKGLVRVRWKSQLGKYFYERLRHVHLYIHKKKKVFIQYQGKTVGFLLFIILNQRQTVLNPRVFLLFTYNVKYKRTIHVFRLLSNSKRPKVKLNALSSLQHPSPTCSFMGVNPCTLQQLRERQVMVPLELFPKHTLVICLTSLMNGSLSPLKLAMHNWRILPLQQINARTFVFKAPYRVP